MPLDTPFLRSVLETADRYKGIVRQNDCAFCGDESVAWCTCCKRDLCDGCMKVFVTKVLCCKCLPAQMKFHGVAN